MMYSKLFSSLVHSSLWSQMDHVRLLFITLLALADRDGIVYGSRSGLERAAMIDLDMAEEYDPWKILMGPDSDSSDLMRNPENEGRRIEEVPGGFRIINYVYYRSLRDAEDRRIQNLEAQARHRKKISQNKPLSATVSRCNPIQSKSEIKTEKKEEKPPKSRCTQKEAEEFCLSIGLPASDGTAMFLHWEEKGWAKVKDWRLTIRKWKSFGYLPSQKQKQNGHRSAYRRGPEETREKTTERLTRSQYQETAAEAAERERRNEIQRQKVRMLTDQLAEKLSMKRGGNHAS